MAITKYDPALVDMMLVLMGEKPVVRTEPQTTEFEKHTSISTPEAINVSGDNKNNVETGHLEIKDKDEESHDFVLNNNAMTMVAVPIFTGVSVELRPWLDFMEQYFVREGDFTEDNKLQMAWGFLEDDAAAWSVKEEQRHIWDNWNTLKHALILRFGEMDERSTKSDASKEVLYEHDGEETFNGSPTLMASEADVMKMLIDEDRSDAIVMESKNKDLQDEGTIDPSSHIECQKEDSNLFKVRGFRMVLFLLAKFNACQYAHQVFDERPQTLHMLKPHKEKRRVASKSWRFKYKDSQETYATVHKLTLGYKSEHTASQWEWCQDNTIGDIKKVEMIRDRDNQFFTEDINFSSQDFRVVYAEQPAATCLHFSVQDFFPSTEKGEKGTIGQEHRFKTINKKWKLVGMFHITYEKLERCVINKQLLSQHMACSWMYTWLEIIVLEDHKHTGVQTTHQVFDNMLARYMNYFQQHARDFLNKNRHKEKVYHYGFNGPNQAQIMLPATKTDQDGGKYVAVNAQRRRRHVDYQREAGHWILVIKLGCLVVGKIQKAEQIYLHFLPMKEYQIIILFVGLLLKVAYMKFMPVQQQTGAGQSLRFKASVVVGNDNGHMEICSLEILKHKLENVMDTLSASKKGQSHQVLTLKALNQPNTSFSPQVTIVQYEFCYQTLGLLFDMVDDGLVRFRSAKISDGENAHQLFSRLFRARKVRHHSLKTPKLRKSWQFKFKIRESAKKRHIWGQTTVKQLCLLGITEKLATTVTGIASGAPQLWIRWFFVTNGRANIEELGKINKEVAMTKDAMRTALSQEDDAKTELSDLMEKIVPLEPRIGVQKDDDLNAHRHGEQHCVVQYCSVGGQLAFKVILFLPQSASIELVTIKNKPNNMQLYVHCVLIKANYEDIILEYVGFIKGIIDSEDLSLTIPRDTLQQNQILKVAHKNLATTCLEFFFEIAENKEDYDKFYYTFSKNLKFSIPAESRGTELAELRDYHSHKSGAKLTSLKDYVSKQTTSTNDINSIPIDSKKASNNSFLDKLNMMRFKVFYVVDDFDGYSMGLPQILEERKLVSTTNLGQKLVDDTNEAKKKQVVKTKLMEHLYQAIKEIDGNKAEIQRTENEGAAEMLQQFFYASSERDVSHKTLNFVQLAGKIKDFGRRGFTLLESLFGSLPRSPEVIYSALTTRFQVKEVRRHELGDKLNFKGGSIVRLHERYFMKLYKHNGYLEQKGGVKKVIMLTRQEDKQLIQAEIVYGQNKAKRVQRKGQ